MRCWGDQASIPTGRVTAESKYPGVFIHTLPTNVDKGWHSGHGCSETSPEKRNKRQKIEKQLGQEQQSYWTTHHRTSGTDYEVPIPAPGHRGQMCPAGLALQHPAFDFLMEYATVGCPVKTAKNWTMEDLEEATEVGPSALKPEAMEQLQAEAVESVRTGQGDSVEGYQK